MNVIKFESKDCERVRGYLDSYLNNELLVETNHEVLNHLEACSGCSEALESRVRVKELLIRAVRRDVDTSALRERIRKSLREKQSRTRLVRGPWALALAATVALLLGGWGMLRFLDQKRHDQAVQTASRLTAEEILKIGLRDHVHCAIESGLAKREFTPEQMASRLGPQYLGLVKLVGEEVPPEYRVKVAHRCRVDGREFIHLILTKEEKALSIVITRKNAESFPKRSLVAVLQAPGVALHQARLEDFEVAGLETRDYLGFVVSDLVERENLQIASGLAPILQDFLAELEG